MPAYTVHNVGDGGSAWSWAVALAPGALLMAHARMLLPGSAECKELGIVEFGTKLVRGPRGGGRTHHKKCWKAARIIRHY